MKNKKTLNIAIIILVMLFILYAGVRAKRNKEGGTSNMQYEMPEYAKWGSYQVGTQVILTGVEKGLELTLWYPASQAASDQTIKYSYGVKMAKPFGTVSIATYEGEAMKDAAFDLSDGPYPLVVLSPGFSISSSSYAWLAEHLASYGFVVISPDHQEHLNPEDQLWRSAITRPQDILTVFTFLDEQVGTGGDFESLINSDLVAVIGHSYGGYTSLAAAGAQIDTGSFETHCREAIDKEDPAAWLCEMLLPHINDMANLAGLDSVPDGVWPAWADPRLDAIVTMAGDAFFFGQEGLSQVTIPILAIGGTADKDSPYLWGTQPSYEYASSSRKAEVALLEAEHMIFTGPCESISWYLSFFSGEFCEDSQWSREYAHDVVTHFVTAFLLAELKNDTNAVDVLGQKELNLKEIEYLTYGY